MGSYDDCMTLLVILRRYKYFIKPYETDKNILPDYKILDANKMITTLEHINIENRYMLIKKLIKFKQATPWIFRVPFRLYPTRYEPSGYTNVSIWRYNQPMQETQYMI